MASWFDDFSLGGAGVIDLISEAASEATGGFLPRSHLAAEVYASQTAQEQNLAPAQQAQLEAAARRATDEGELQVALQQTKNQVAAAVDTGLKDAVRYAKWAGAALGATLLLVGGVKAYQLLSTED